MAYIFAKKKMMGEIRINVEELYKRLFTESGYIAHSRSAMGLYDSIVGIMNITDDERRIIDKWIRSSVNEIAHAINRYLSPCCAKYYNDDSSGAEYVISFKIPHNYPKETVSLLQECAADLAFKRTMQQWNMAMKPDEANITATGAQADAIRFRELLAQRKKPAREEKRRENIIEL